MAQLHDLSALDLRDELRSGAVGPVEVSQHFLARIAEHDDGLGAFTTVTPERASERAQHLESHRPADDEYPLLWGMPLADKDLNDRAGVPTGHGSRLGGGIPAQSEQLVHDLDAAGVVSLGKTASPEFGLYGYTESAVAPPTRHPEASHLGVGGSSGGAAAAVAARLLPFAPGSDGGGSVRIPAAATGLVGIKPTRILIPADAAAGPSFTGVVSGPIAHSVADAALLFDGMMAAAGPDRERFGRAAASVQGPLRIAVVTASPWDDSHGVAIDPAGLEALADATKALQQAGHVVLNAGESKMIRYPRLDYPGIFTMAWQRSAAAIPAHTEHELNLLMPVTRELVLRGRAITPEQAAQNDTDLATYGAALREAFSEVDIVLTPALAQSPRPIGAYSDDADVNFAQQVAYSPFTSAINVAGLPAISLPAGRYEVDFSEVPLPMGVQLVGRFGDDATLVSVAAQLERVLALPLG
ncbi:amidase [Lysinibacter cavernae]|uniref:Amidase n=1 Tax=Lysinibacter cavernae TaxID=1640652 RepID=A0A7X5R3J2_9MICO|nr:amidase [Lysinibacter cavernae]NIH54961.1 amidase [Lysinibacter cavernae]